MKRLSLLLIAIALFASATAMAQTTASSSPTSQTIRQSAPVTQPIPSEDRTIEAAKAEQEAQSRAGQVEADLAAVREILAIGLDNDEVGELLREARARVPDTDALRQRIDKRERALAEARLNRVRLIERLRLASNARQIGHLSDAIDDQEAYIAATQRALEAELALAKQTRELLTLLDSRLLWIGSAPAIGPSWLGDVARGARWLGDPQCWLGVGQTLLQRFWLTILLLALLLPFVGVLIVARPGLARRLPELAKDVNNFSNDSFLLTIRASIITLLLVASGPVVLAVAGAFFITQRVDLFAQAIGDGLLSAAAVYLLVGVFRELCRDNGVADAHFAWHRSARKTLLNNLRWFLVVAVLAAFVAGTCDAGSNEIHRQGLGRLAFLVGATALTVFIARVFRPNSGIFAAIFSPTGWAWRLRKLWYALLVLIPAALIFAAAAGYYYTAVELLRRFFFSGVVNLVGIIIYSLMTRWLLVARRRLAMQQARQKLAEQREARRNETAEGKPGLLTGTAKPELDPRTVDVAAASQRTLSLLRTLIGLAVLAILWAVWKDVLPALSVLQRIHLTEPTLNAAGGIVVASVTLWSLLMGLLALVLTAISARNLPAVLELTILQRFPIDHGVRFAAAAITRYVVIAIGIIIASNLFGIDWSRAQWIIAALGVGLGFGLQEIVANFISGLIILFERPVRVGDTVTVGNVSGVVSRLQIRATTITDWDNKEVLVPNKSFLTDRVVNWTLSNSVTRLLIPVGIAYGSDIATAQCVITEAVKSVSAVLRDPAPSVLFVAFGDSALNFEIRAFVADLSDRLPATHDLHTAINNALKSANIEIPFPQRDLHLHGSDIAALTSPNGAPAIPAPAPTPAAPMTATTNPDAPAAINTSEAPSTPKSKSRNS